MMNIAAVLLLQLLLRMELLYSGAVSIDPELLSMPFLEHFAFEYYITNCMGRASVLYRSQKFASVVVWFQPVYIIENTEDKR